MERPFFLHDGKGYSCTWVDVEDETGTRTKATVVFDSTFENCWSDHDLDGHGLIEDLPFTLDLAGTPVPGSFLSADSYVKYVIEKEPLPSYAAVFNDVVTNLDAFIAFDDTTGSQIEQSEMLAAFVAGTYLINEFHATPYLWFGGERGSGKTQASLAVAKLSSLGFFTQGTSTFASLRETAALGGLIGCDDFENWRSFDPDKKNMFLSGTTRGATISLSRQGDREGDWQPAHIPVYGPKLFSAISSPDDVLRSRSIFVELKRSNDTERTRRSPTNDADWLVSPELLRDQLWLVSVRYLTEIEAIRTELEEKIDLNGRDRDNLLPLLVAAKLAEIGGGNDGLADRLLDLFIRNKDQQQALAPPSEIEIVIRVLNDLLRSLTSKTMPTDDIRSAFVAYCERQDIGERSYLDISNQRIGQMLSRLRFQASASHGSRRSWEILRTTVLAAARSECIQLSVTSTTEDDPASDRPACISTMFENSDSDDERPSAPWE